MQDSLDKYVDILEKATGEHLGRPKHVAVAVMSKDFFYQAKRLWDIDERSYREYLDTLYTYIEQFLDDDVELVAVKLDSTAKYDLWCKEHQVNPGETTSRAAYAAWYVEDGTDWNKYLENGGG